FITADRRASEFEPIHHAVKIGERALRVGMLFNEGYKACAAPPEDRPRQAVISVAKVGGLSVGYSVRLKVASGLELGSGVGVIAFLASLVCEQFFGHAAGGLDERFTSGRAPRASASKYPYPLPVFTPIQTTYGATYSSSVVVAAPVPAPTPAS